MNVRNRHIKGKNGWLKHLDFLMIDIISLIISFSVSYIFKFKDWEFLYSSTWKEVLILSILLDLVIIFFTGPFSGILRRYGAEEMLKTALHSFYNFVGCCIILYVLKIGADYSRTVIILMYVFHFLISLVLRIFWKGLIKKQPFSRKKKSIVIVGVKERMPYVLRSINSAFLNEYKIEGICVIDAELGEEVTGRIDIIDADGKVRELYEKFTNTITIENLVSYVLEKNVGEVFIDVQPSEINGEIYETLVKNGKGIHINVETMLGYKPDDQFITTVGTYKSLSIGIHSFAGKQLVYFSVKRLMDILIGILGMILLIPLMLIVKLSYVFSGDHAPIFYTQTRVGLDGRIFKMYKFRSMVHNADEILKELLKDPKRKKEWEENQKFENDPRITKMGAILRKTSLDEIPQFINVLIGNMSFIGPRPLVVGELEMHNGLQLYNQVRPGVTGWWGCNGRSNTTYDERLELEYYYIKNCSLYLDSLCVVKTIVAILKHDGAR